MTLIEQIEAAWKTAMKERDPAKEPLSLMRTEVKNRVISERKDGPGQDKPTDELVTTTLMKMAKQRTESIMEYGKAGRDDLVSKEKFELAVIEKYLPKPFTTDEIREIARAAIAEAGVTSAKDIGKVMKIVLPKCAGRAPGKEVQEILRALLQ